MDSTSVFSKLLIAIDASEAAERAASKGLALAALMDIPATLLSVIDRSQEILQTDLEVKPILTATILKQQAEERLKKLQALYMPDALKGKVNTVCLEGLPREQILSTLKDIGADLLVVGTHARKGLAHFLLGSTAEFLVRNACIPVMVVPSVAS